MVANNTGAKSALTVEKNITVRLPTELMIQIDSIMDSFGQYADLLSVGDREVYGMTEQFGAITIIKSENPREDWRYWICCGVLGGAVNPSQTFAKIDQKGRAYLNRALRIGGKAPAIGDLINALHDVLGITFVEQEVVL
ncbi:hypothetical protein OAO01_08920, partial [Oligoflexia bacterium]|nr:hypothetical protein [Oligoflexia bacterium]